LYVQALLQQHSTSSSVSLAPGPLCVVAVATAVALHTCKARRQGSDVQASKMLYNENNPRAGIVIMHQSKAEVVMCQYACTLYTACTYTLSQWPHPTQWLSKG
jgi:hypothetical protein